MPAGADTLRGDRESPRPVRGRNPEEPFAGQASRVEPGLRRARDDRTSRPPREGGDPTTRRTSGKIMRWTTRWAHAGFTALRGTVRGWLAVGTAGLLATL